MDNLCVHYYSTEEEKHEWIRVAKNRPANERTFERTTPILNEMLVECTIL